MKGFRRAALWIWSGNHKCVKLFIGIAVCAWLLSRVDVLAVGALLRETQRGPLLLSFTNFALLILLTTLRLYVLASEHLRSYGQTLHFVLVSYFFNSLFLGTYGGDGYKVFALKNHAASWSSIVTLVALDRALGISVVIIAGGICLAYMDLPAFLLNHHRLPDAFSDKLSPAGVFAFIAGFAVLVGLLLRLLFCSRRTRGILREIARTFYRISTRRHLSAIALSVLAFISRVVRFYAYLLCFGHTLPFSNIVVVLFLMHLVMLLPVTLGGLGLQETAIAFGLQAFGIPLPVGVAIGALNRGIIVAISLLGGVLFATQRRRSSSTESKATQ